jgi:hypothetical protein
LSARQIENQKIQTPYTKPTLRIVKTGWLDKMDCVEKF